MTDSHPPNFHRQQQWPPTSPSKSSSASLRGCLCCFFILLSLLLIFLLAAILVVAFAVKPQKPQFDLQQVFVSYILVSPGAPSAYLSLNITLLFTAKNPNKIAIRYGAAVFSVMYRGVPLGFAELPSFEQPAYSVRLVETRVVIDHVNVFQSDAGELVRDATVNDRVEFRVAGDVAAKIRFLGITSPRVQVSVDCVIVISPKKQSLTYKQCGVDGLNV